MSFCLNQKGHKGGEGGFDECKSFWCIWNPYISLMPDLLYFGINIVVSYTTILPLNFYSTLELFRMCDTLEIFFGRIIFKSQSQLVATTWHWPVTQTHKIGSVSKTSMQESNFDNIWSTLWHFQDVSTTFPTKQEDLPWKFF